jgi:hypothetical protein
VSGTLALGKGARIGRPDAGVFIALAY